MSDQNLFRSLEQKKTNRIKIFRFGQRKQTRRFRKPTLIRTSDTIFYSVGHNSSGWHGPGTTLLHLLARSLSLSPNSGCYSLPRAATIPEFWFFGRGHQRRKNIRRFPTPNHETHFRFLTSIARHQTAVENFAKSYAIKANSMQRLENLSISLAVPRQQRSPFMLSSTVLARKGWQLWKLSLSPSRRFSPRLIGAKRVGTNRDSSQVLKHF